MQQRPRHGIVTELWKSNSEVQHHISWYNGEFLNLHQLPWPLYSLLSPGLDFQSE
jgi:hypothetical protein